MVMSACRYGSVDRIPAWPTPERDHGGVDAGVEQRHRAAVPQDVGVESFPSEARAAVGGGVGVDPQRDRVAAEAAPLPGGEQGLVGLSGSFTCPFLHHCGDGCGEGDGSLFATFAFAADVGADAEGQVGWSCTHTRDCAASVRLYSSGRTTSTTENPAGTPRVHRVLLGSAPGVDDHRREAVLHDVHGGAQLPAQNRSLGAFGSQDCDPR